MAKDRPFIREQATPSKRPSQLEHIGPRSRALVLVWAFPEHVRDEFKVQTMIIIWSGWGLTAPLFGALGLIVSVTLLGFTGGGQEPLALAIGGLTAAVICWIAGTFLKGRLFFIPLKYYSLLYLVIFGALAAAGSQGLEKFANDAISSASGAATSPEQFAFVRQYLTPVKHVMHIHTVEAGAISVPQPDSEYRNMQLPKGTEVSITYIGKWPDGTGACFVTAQGPNGPIKGFMAYDTRGAEKPDCTVAQSDGPGDRSAQSTTSSSTLSDEDVVALMIDHLRNDDWQSMNAACTDIEHMKFDDGGIGPCGIFIAPRGKPQCIAENRAKRRVECNEERARLSSPAYGSNLVFSVLQKANYEGTYVAIVNVRQKGNDQTGQAKMYVQWQNGKWVITKYSDHMLDSNSSEPAQISTPNVTCRDTPIVKHITGTSLADAKNYLPDNLPANTSLEITGQEVRGNVPFRTIDGKTIGWLNPKALDCSR